MKRAPVVLLISTLIVLIVSETTAQSPASRHLWVIGPGEGIAEYDAGTFSRLRTVPLPPGRLQESQEPLINRLGQILLRHEGGSVWFWNGRAGTMLQEGGSPSEDLVPRWFLSADGKGLYVAENDRRIVNDRDGAESSVTTRVRVSLANLEGRRQQPIAEISLPACQCTTGVCTETCPVGEAWAPAGI